MTMQETPKENAEAIAIHEAGHLVVGVAFGRRLEKVSLDLIDGVRGCFWKPVGHDEWNDFEELCSLLAGPCVQVELKPESIPAERRRRFAEQIIQPMEEGRRIPTGVYDYLGWQHDIESVYKRLCLPQAQAPNMPFGVTHETVVRSAERKLLKFFNSANVQQYVRRIAERLLADRCISGVVATTLLKENDLRVSADINDLLSWDS